MFIPFTETHAAAAAALHAACFPDSWPAHAFATLLATGSQGFICLDEDNAAGVILARSAGDEAEILTLAVNPEHRNEGIGTGLLLRLISSLQTGPATRLYLEVAEDNVPALALYASAGFTKVGERSGYYRNKENAVTALIMMRTLIEA